jgi:hypothetical protein
MEKVKIG